MINEEKNKNAYLLIDSSSILSEQYFGMKNSKDKYVISLQGKEINLSAIYGYFNFLKKIEEEYNLIPKENIVHVLDPSGGSVYRKNIYPEYKSNRKEKEEDFTTQRDLLGFFLKAKGYKFLQIKGVEADDVIGTLANKLSKDKNEVLIFSKDKDLLQLLDENTYLTRWEKNSDNNKQFTIYTQDYVYQKYGFMPETIVDFLAIKGDAADNIPGVHKVGEKTAIKLLVEFLNVEGILNNLDNIPEKTRKLIIANKENLILSKKLTLILRELENVPMIEDIKCEINQDLKMKFLKILENFNV